MDQESSFVTLRGSDSVMRAQGKLSDDHASIVFWAPRPLCLQKQRRQYIQECIISRLSLSTQTTCLPTQKASPPLFVAKQIAPPHSLPILPLLTMLSNQRRTISSMDLFPKPRLQTRNLSSKDLNLLSLRRHDLSLLRQHALDILQHASYAIRGSSGYTRTRRGRWRC